MTLTTIRLNELPPEHWPDDPFALYMRSDTFPLHTVHMMGVPFGTVLQEVSRFLDLNVR